MFGTYVTYFHNIFNVITHIFLWTCHGTYKSFFSPIHRGVKPKSIPSLAPVFLRADSSCISWQLSHNSSLLVCLCCTFILFVVTFPRPSHLSTWKTLMRLQRDIKASPSPRHSLWLFRFMGFFFLLQHERPSVFPLTDVCAWTHTDIHIMHVCTHTFSLSHRPTQSCRNRMIAKSNETPPVFQREGVCAKQWYEIKREKKDEGEADGWSGHGGLYVLVKVALGNKSSFECAPTQKRD